MSLAVIILSKDVNNLAPCVAAVKKNEPEARIIVVDDGLAWHPHGCDYIGGAKPFCYARNANIGIRAATIGMTRHPDDCQCGTCGPEQREVVWGGPWQDVVLLNDDALLTTPGGFSLLQRTCEERPEYGLIGSTCNNVGNPNQRPRGQGLRDESRMVCFVCVFIPARTIEAVGLLDEDLIGYGLDDDSYCLRTRRAGLKIGIHDGCYVDHGSLRSSFRGGPASAGDYRPNLRRFIAKYGVDNWGNTRETSQFKDLFPPEVTR